VDAAAANRRSSALLHRLSPANSQRKDELNGREVTDPHSPTDPRRSSHAQQPSTDEQLFDMPGGHAITIR
jgi:hypothetical protein